jgi:NAD(P)-dependent dehydrogenase (short-subunit alcohol dehydrogenase family)
VEGRALDQHTMDDVNLSFESGVFATFRYMLACLPYLKEAQGTIINFASEASIGGMAGYGAYNANKEAIRGLTRTAAREWGQFGITANVIAPAIWTEAAKQVADAYPDMLQAHIKTIPLGRIGDAEEDAGGLAVFLTQPGGHYMTGMTFDLNGGVYLRP